MGHKVIIILLLAQTKMPSNFLNVKIAALKKLYNTIKVAILLARCITVGPGINSIRKTHHSTRVKNIIRNRVATRTTCLIPDTLDNRWTTLCALRICTVLMLTSITSNSLREHTIINGSRSNIKINTAQKKVDMLQWTTTTLSLSLHSMQADLGGSSNSSMLIQCRSHKQAVDEEMLTGATTLNNSITRETSSLLTTKVLSNRWLLIKASTITASRLHLVESMAAALPSTNRVSLSTNSRSTMATGAHSTRSHGTTLLLTTCKSSSHMGSPPAIRDPRSTSKRGNMSRHLPNSGAARSLNEAPAALTSDQDHPPTTINIRATNSSSPSGTIRIKNTSNSSLTTSVTRRTIAKTISVIITINTEHQITESFLHK